MTKTVTACFKTSDGFLKGLFVVLSNTHNFTDRTHLCAQLIFNAFEFLKSPACKLDNHIVSIRYIFVQGTIFSARNILQCQACCQHCRHKSDWETCGLRSQSRWTWCTWINLDNNNSVCHRIMSKLYVCTTNNLNRFNNLISLFLKTFLAFFRDCQHWCCTERIAGMHTQRVDILNKTYRNHVVIFIADNFQFQFFPSKNGLFYKNLAHKTGLKTSGTNSL